MNPIFSMLAALLVTVSSCNTISLTSGGKSSYTIVVETPDSLTLFAANELQRYIKQISGVELPISTSTDKNGKEIIIGNTTQNNSVSIDSLGRFGFNISVLNDNLFITSKEGRGAMYGVYTFLEEQLGVRLYSKDVEIIPSIENIKLSKSLNTTQVPVITFRDVYYTPTNDRHYINFHKLSHDETGNKPEWGLWVHTFSTLVPPDEYFETHPEYYSLISGKRKPEQLCLSTPHVFGILCSNLKKEIDANPDALYWSVSSNDNFGYCQCDECKKLDDIDGSPTGSVIQFVNKVAERFPDKIISTLAYQYSRKAPKTTRPAKNVNIMFCNIECNRSEAIATDPTSESFREDMENWAKLTDNILVWDYIIQFKNLVSPFPNFHTLAPNVRYFVDNSVVALFEQGNREIGGEFADMRSYIMSKLLWNPYADTDSIMIDFCKGYYGEGGVFVKEYVDLITKNLIESKTQIGIFGSPCDAENSYLKPEQLKEYQAIFDKAEAAVAKEPEVLKRVKIARQPLYYAELEQSKLDPYGENGVFIKTDEGKWITNPLYITKLNNFISLCKAEGVTRLSEWHTTPDEYHKIMNEMAVSRNENSLSFEKPVTLDIKPNPKYDKAADKILTNGIFGAGDYSLQWLGWDVPKFSVTVDLGEIKDIKYIAGHFLQSISSWIFYPLSVEYSISDNGTKFAVTDVISHPIDREHPIETKKFESKKALKARYIKATITGVGTCPKWHIGAGDKAHVFMDEFIVE